MDLDSDPGEEIERLAFNAALNGLFAAPSDDAEVPLLMRLKLECGEDFWSEEEEEDAADVDSKG